MIVWKSTYDELFDLFIKEKHGALELYKDNQRLLTERLNLIDENTMLRAEINYLKGKL